MPAKFKPSERVYKRNQRGVRMSTDNEIKRYKHYYIKQTPLAELMETINSDRSKPKQKQKCRNEVVKRGYNLVYKMPDGTTIPRTFKALKEYVGVL